MGRKVRPANDDEGFPLDWVLMGLMLAALIWMTA